MSQPEIIEKINRLLTNHMPLEDESKVLYLLVEFRKLLDRYNDGSFPLLRFYCDWSVHTAKDRITPTIKAIMEQVFMHRHPEDLEGILLYRNFVLADFSKLENLKEEMETFLLKYGFDISVLEDKNWPDFTHQLVNILADQPINRPCPGIESFRFKPSPFGAVIGEIVYSPGAIDPPVLEFAVAY